MDVPVASLQTLFGYRSVALDSLGIRSDDLSSMTGRETCPRYLFYLPGLDLEKVRRAVRAAAPGWIE